MCNKCNNDPQKYRKIQSLILRSPYTNHFITEKVGGIFMSDKQKVISILYIESNNFFTQILFTLKWDKFPCVQGKRQIFFCINLEIKEKIQTIMDSKPPRPLRQ